MALNLPDFSNIAVHKNDYSGFADAFGNILKGYKQGREPYRMQQEEQQQALLNKLNNQKFLNQEENQPHELEKLKLGNENQRNVNQYYGQDMQAKLAEAMARANKYNLESQFYPEKIQADIERLKAEARNAGLTPAQKQVGELFERGSPEYENAMRQQLGLPLKAGTLPVGVPEGSFPYPVGVNDRAKVNQAQHAKLQELYQIDKANNALRDMRKILEEHPDMSDYISTALINPDSDPSVWQQIKRKLVNKKDLAAIEKVQKLGNELVVDMGTTFGKSFTDARQRLVSKIKPEAGRTKEANLFIIDRMLEESSYAPAMKAALKAGIKNSMEVSSDPYDYMRPHDEKAEALNNPSNKTNAAQDLTYVDPLFTPQYIKERAEQLGVDVSELEEMILEERGAQK